MDIDCIPPLAIPPLTEEQEKAILCGEWPEWPKFLEFKKEKTMFKKEDIKPGMAVILRGGMKCVLIPSSDGNLAAVNIDHRSSPVEIVIYKDRAVDPLAPVRKKDIYDIMSVYSEASPTQKILDIPERRKLLWEREEILEVTMAEVEEKFGCPVKIIREEK